jgi:hypothetical protein
LIDFSGEVDPIHEHDIDLVFIRPVRCRIKDARIDAVGEDLARILIGAKRFGLGLYAPLLQGFKRDGSIDAVRFCYRDADLINLLKIAARIPTDLREAECGRCMRSRLNRNAWKTDQSE